MSSSLASQLAGIRSHNAARLASSSALTARDSYLFTPRAAAEQDHLTVHALGVTGWEQLLDEDAVLASWPHGDLLFGERSIHTDRTTLPKQVNDEIDEAVRELLYLLGPVLLSRSAAKCLEWLIRRFRIHEYTSRELLRAFMPYHHTPQFARMLQVIPIEKYAEWQFLVPVKKAQSSLPTSLLVQALGSNLDVLRWIASNQAPVHVSVRRAHIPFWTSTLVQFCLLHRRANKRRHGVDAQAILTVLVPEVLLLLDGTFNEEAVVGALMVLCTLSVAFPLSAKAVRGLIDAVSQLAASSAKPAVARAIVAACISMCASPDDVDDPLSYVATGRVVEESHRLLSESTVRALVQLPEFGAQIARALRTHDIEPFMSQLLGSLASDVSFAPARSMLESVLDDDALPRVLSLRTCVILMLAPHDDAWDVRIALLARLRERHPSILDEALLVARNSDEARAWQVIQAVLHMQATGKVPTASDSQDTALWLGVQSADAHAQELALDRLLQAVGRGHVCGNDSLVRDAAETGFARGLVDVLYRHAAILVDAIGPSCLLDTITTRLHDESISAHERDLHLKFVTETLVPRAPALSQRVWRELLWSQLLPCGDGDSDTSARRYRRLIGGFVSCLEHVKEPMAQIASTTAARMSASKEASPLTWTLALSDALVRHLATCDEPTFLDEADFLCNAVIRSPISPGGALALLVIGQLLARALPPRVWVTLAYQATSIVHTQQLLAGQLDDVIMGDKADEAIMQQVLDKLSRRSVRLLGVQLMHTVLQHFPTSSMDASLFMDIQQRTKPLAQLILHMYQTLHAPGVGLTASVKLVPVLFERLDLSTFALLAGLWTTPGGHGQRSLPRQSLSLASLACALEEGSLVPPSSVSVRLMAMRHATLLARAASSKKRALDLQTLLPSLLVVLQDSVPVLRNAAAQLLGALDAWNAACGKDDREVYGFEQVYGVHSAPLQYLDTPTYAKYTSLLAKEAGAFVNDASFLATTHTSILRGSGKKEVLFRTKVLCYLMSHALCLPDLSMRMALFGMVRDVHAPCKLSTALPLVAEAIDAQEPMNPTYLQLLYETYDASAVPVLEDRKTHAFSLFLRSLRSDAPSGLQQVSLDALQHGLFVALRTEDKQKVYLTMAETLADPRVASVPNAGALLRSFPLSDAVLVSVLRTLCDSLATDDDEPSSKRARSSSSSTSLDEHVQKTAIVLITVLESIQSRTLGMEAALVAALFDVVRTAISLSSTHLFNAEYLLQLAMQSLCNLFDHVTELPTDVAQVVRADTIVSAIKVSTNTQSINHAILLLARFARLDAELVLHNIMPIFTFVGLNVLQRDDRFTLSVVEQTLRSIMPAFVNAVRPQVINDKDARLALWCETRSLLRIFSDASTHIPRHRRHVFFRLLVDVLGADDFLAPVCMLLADRVAHRVSKAPSNSSALMQLPLGLMRAESFPVRVHALNQIWAEVMRLLHGSDDVFLAPVPRREYSDEHLSTLHQVHALLLFLQDAMYNVDPREAEQCADQLQQYAWHTLCLAPPDEVIQNALDKARTPVFQMLPTPTFLTLVLVLLRGQHEAPGVRGHIPSSLSSVQLQKAGLALLQSHAPLTTEVRTAQAETLDAVHQALMAIFESHASSQLSMDALGALHTSIMHCVPAEHAHVAALMPQLLAHEAQPILLRALSDMVVRVGVRALSHLSRLVPYACQAVESASSLSRADGARDRDDDLCSAGLSMLAALFKTLAQFMHAYVERVVRLLCHPILQQHKDSSAQTRNAKRKVQDAVVKRMPAATVLEALASAWRDTDVSRTAILHLLQLAVRNMDKSAIATHYKAVYRFVLQAMDEQRHHKTAPAEQAPRKGEAVLPSVLRSVEVFVTLALKLSETQFRPLFLRTYDWALVDLLDQDAPGVQARALTLYTLVNSLFEHLHAMMAPFYAVLVDNALEILQQTLSRDTITATALWHQVARSVRLCAESDEGLFWNAARAKQFVPPLVAALQHETDQDTDGDVLVPATLLALAKAVPEDEFLRTLNTSLMSAASTNDVTSRVRALSVCASLWAAHGMALLTFVPETVAALSELLDDSDPRTSAAALQLRVHIEEALGEPLDSYLESTI